ncbi:DUF4181 domain-containing protein [Halobacillus sp. A5]|uniref:DUF4181 domain-containing protein n=1 Tax=Halobacillus sp. A5 TaxID=2880263 RepID=UPI0020A69457|nr:DUF4181 domain-containing protein [Halobacillus sp. A5]MCP3026504.1 DUF4181 domain-containing protein [Halobacillus sp. A5]
MAYGLQDGFWVEFIPLIGALGFILIGIPAVLRYIWGADKRNWNLNVYINDFHRKGDWCLKTIFLLIFLASTFIFYPNTYIPFIISMVFAFAQLVFQTYVEWKFAENRRNYKVSFVELILLFVIFVWVMLWIDKQ